MDAPQRTNLQIKLPVVGRKLEAFALSAPRNFPEKPVRAFTRIAYSAAHMVADPLVPHNPWLEAAIDWDTTIAYRRALWDLGLGIAEAMDTAQRGMGLNWPTSLELIRRSVAGDAWQELHQIAREARLGEQLRLDARHQPRAQTPLHVEAADEADPHHERQRNRKELETDPSVQAPVPVGDSLKR